MFRPPVKYMIAYLFGLSAYPILVFARFCDGGHICSLPRECCTQGCCPPYQNSARQIPPGTDHVLNLFFINHWFFWCVIVAIVLAILCVYSIWKKRQQLCGWGFPDQQAQSEGDSAGSCYAPPMYSRCNSFYHPPPPYTEVTSKPDLYPLVFTCNSDNAKNGTGYLMVQYFRNYIVRPGGSLSATSTIDSISSSFICNANEANILVPPPYSRAASPDIATNTNFEQQHTLPRSVSQHMFQQDRNPLQDNYSSSLSDCNTTNNAINYKNAAIKIVHQSQSSKNLESLDNKPSGSNNCNERSNICFLSERDRKFRYIMNNNHSLNDTFVNNSYSGNINIDSTTNNYAQKQVPVTTISECEYTDLNVLRHNLETCCQFLQHQNTQSVCLMNSNHTSVDGDLTRKINDGIQNYITSATCSAVSSLANIDSPSSPPQPTSPTGEMRNMLDQVRQLQIDNSLIDNNINQNNDLSKKNVTKQMSSLKRPATLQTKNKFFLKQNRGMYIPISTSNSKFIRSPVNSTNIFSKHRGRKSWISLSAPTTPGTSLPSTCLGDDSPLLNEHDEDDGTEHT